MHHSYAIKICVQEKLLLPPNKITILEAQWFSFVPICMIYGIHKITKQRSVHGIKSMNLNAVACLSH